MPQHDEKLKTVKDKNTIFKENMYQNVRFIKIEITASRAERLLVRIIYAICFYGCFCSILKGG